MILSYIGLKICVLRVYSRLASYVAWSKEHRHRPLGESAQSSAATLCLWRDLDPSRAVWQERGGGSCAGQRRKHIAPKNHRESLKRGEKNGEEE